MKVMNAKVYPKIFKAAIKEFGEDNALRLSAALAYYSMFSIGPLLVIAVGVAGLVFGHAAVRAQFEQQLQSLLGQNSARMIESMMSAQKHGASLITTIVGIAALLLGAAGVFGQLQDALNTIWGVTSKPGKGLWGLIRKRFLSMSMVLGVGFLLLVSMAISTFLTAVTGSIGNSLPVSEVLLHALNFTVSFAVITALFAMIFKYLPDVKIPFRKVWPGAALTAFLFTIGKYLLALYLGRESTASSYGAAGSVIIVMMWVYYASVILFFGAEFSQVYVLQTGTKVVPSEYAVPVTREARAQQGMAPQTAPATAQPAHLHSPGRVIRTNPWEFASLMFAAGIAGAFWLRFKTVRKAVRLVTHIAGKS